MRRTAVAALAAVGMLLVAGCASFPAFGPDPRPVATPVAEVDCGASGEQGTGGRVPEDFAAVAILRCDGGALREDEAGLWSGTLVTRFEGDLDAVLEALAVPSDPRSLGACSAIGYVVPDIWVEGTDGTVVRAWLPSGGCGEPKEIGLDAALSALTVTAEDFERQTLMESRAAMTAGCPSQASPFILDVSEQTMVVEPGASAEPIPVPAPPQRGASSPPRSDTPGLRVCAYSTEPPEEASPMSMTLAGSGYFVGAFDLGAGDARAVASAVASAAPAATCRVMARRFVVAYDLDRLPAPPTDSDGMAVSISVPTPSIMLELDGCGRLIDSDFAPLTAPPGVIASLTPGEEVLSLSPPGTSGTPAS